MKHSILLVLTTISFAGCVASPAIPDYSALSIDELCSLWRVDQVALNELDLRAGFSEREWSAIQQSKVFVGMSEDALVCSRGLPTVAGFGEVFFGFPGYAEVRVNVQSQDGDWGTRSIHTYSYRDLQSQWQGRDVRPLDMKIWVFVENGVVVNFAHGPKEDVYNYEFTSAEFWWKGYKKPFFTFSLLKPPPEDAWYALQD